jgi:hypothetical protein
MSIVVVVAFSTGLQYYVLLNSRLICIRVFVSTYYNLIHSRLLYVLEYLLLYYWWRRPIGRCLPTEALRRTNNFRMVTATPTMETKD